MKITEVNSSSSLKNILKKSFKNSHNALIRVDKIGRRICPFLTTNLKKKPNYFALRVPEEVVKIKADLKTKELIGHGGCARVYKVDCTCFTKPSNRKFKKILAVKIINVNGTRNPLLNFYSHCFVPFAITSARAKEEVEILKDVQSHSYILKFHVSLMRFNRMLIVTDFCEAGDLADVFQNYATTAKTSGFPVRIIRLLIAPIFSALAHCNRQRIIHRDIKPMNILIKHSLPKLADFGTAVRIPKHQRSRPCEMFPEGTFGLMAPETVRSDHQNYSVDTWSVCVMALMLIHGTDAYAVKNNTTWEDVVNFFHQKDWKTESDSKLDKAILNMYGFGIEDVNQSLQKDWIRLKRMLAFGMKRNIHARYSPKKMLQHTYLSKMLKIWKQRGKQIDVKSNELYAEWLLILKGKRMKVKQIELTEADI